MGVLSRAARRRIAIGLSVVLVVCAAVACRDEAGGPGVYPARGIVEDVDREGAQVLIDHEDVDGLMPAMTMNFAVPDEGVLAGLAPGQVIEFDLRFTGRSYEVEAFEVVGEATAEAGWRRLGDALVRTSPVPSFSLVDQARRGVDESSFGDRLLVVDFVYTECPGPCPIQTAAQAALQKRLPDDVQARVQFLSISLDPANDTPEKLEAYALERGADLSNWSFLTGEPEAVAAVVRAWGIGSVRKEDGTIDHTLITFLARSGRVMGRYSMQEIRDDRLFEDLVTLARSAPQPQPEPGDAHAGHARDDAHAGEGSGDAHAGHGGAGAPAP